MFWVALPLLLYALLVAGALLARRALGKRTLELHLSLFLMAYLLVTMGLGLFWVASQQLPVFDLHYLFGYLSALLVAVHLSFTLPRAWRQLRRRTSEQRPRKATTSRALSLGGWLAALTAVALSFVLGMRHGSSDLPVVWDGGVGDIKGPVATVVRYHEQSSLSRRGVFVRAPNVDWGAEPAAFKLHPQSERVALPPATWDGAARSLDQALRGPAQTAAQRITLQKLAGILHHAAGITSERGGHALRASPSSGALFPAEIYVAAQQVEGLTAGIYHYDPLGHGLERVSSESPAARALGVPHLPAGPLALVVTVMLRRTGFKYGHRAYRYAVADVGHLLENLRIGAAEAGLEALPLLRFDEARVAGALGVDGVEESVIAVVGSSWGPRAAQAAPHTFLAAPTDVASAVGASGLVHRGTSLQAVTAEPIGPEVDRLALPAPRASNRGALALIRARRSERRYSDQPLSLELVSSILAEASQPVLLTSALRVHLVVNRVEGLEPGVYRYLPAPHALLAVRKGELSSEARSAALAQDVIGDAAAVFMVSADREALFAEAGARGYRHALLETGMVGERILLAAVARELGACPVGAFYDDDAAELLSLAPERAWVLHMVALGAKSP